MGATIGGNSVKQQVVEAHLIEEVLVIPKTGVNVISDQATLQFGAGLAKDELDHVRAAVLATLARGTVRSEPVTSPAGTAGTAPQAPSRTAGTESLRRKTVRPTYTLDLTDRGCWFR